jgi:hypothetical protein
LDLAEEVKVEEKSKDNPPSSKGAGGMPDEVKSDSIITDPGKEHFIKRRTESLKAHWAQAAELTKAGIPYSFGTLSGKPGDFFKNMQIMIENGLHPDDALRSLTIVPARLLGIEKHCGSIAPGQMANLIISTKPIFEKEAAIRYMIVEGHIYHYDAPAKKKKESKDDPAAHSLLEGKWDYVIDVPDQKRTGQLAFDHADGQWSGTITSSEITTGNKQLDAIVFDGKEASFTFDYTIEGQPVVWEFDLLLKEEAFAGLVNVGAFGTFPIAGTRSSHPDQQ